MQCMRNGLCMCSLIFRPWLIDAITAAQTTDGQKVLMDTLKFNVIDEIELPERYVLAVAFSTHPPQIVLKQLLASILMILIFMCKCFT